MIPYVVERFPETVVFVQKQGDYNNTPKVAFNELIEKLAQNALYNKIDRIYGMGLDNPRKTNPSLCRFDACASLVVKEYGGLETKKLEAGRFAVFVHVGHYSKLGETCAKIFTEILPQSSYKLRNDQLTFCEFVNFLTPNMKQEDKEIKIYVPIQA